MTCGVSTTLQWFSLVFFNQWDESPIFSHKRLRFSDLSDRLHLPSQSWAVSQLRPCRVFPGVVEEVRSELDSYHGRHSSHWIPHDGGETHRHPSGQHGGLRRHRSSWNFMKRWRDLWGFGILCWLVVWNMNFMFPYIGNNTPNWRTHIFRGVGIPPTRLDPFRSIQMALLQKMVFRKTMPHSNGQKKLTRNHGPWRYPSGIMARNLKMLFRYRLVFSEEECC